MVVPGRCQGAIQGGSPGLIHQQGMAHAQPLIPPACIAPLIPTVPPGFAMPIYALSPLQACFMSWQHLSLLVKVWLEHLTVLNPSHRVPSTTGKDVSSHRAAAFKGAVCFIAEPSIVDEQLMLCAESGRMLRSTCQPLRRSAACLPRCPGRARRVVRPGCRLVSTLTTVA